jgi:hypothetical protein
MIRSINMKLFLFFELYALLGCIRLIIQQRLSTFVSWRTEKQQCHENNKRCQIERGQEHTPKSQSAVSTPQANKKTRQDIKGYICWIKCREIHVFVSSKCIVLTSYLTGSSIATINQSIGV